MYVENGWLSLDPIYLSLLHPHEFSDNFSDMDGFQDSGAQGVLQYNLLKYHGVCDLMQMKGSRRL